MTTNIEALERQLAVEKERADYGWRNVNILEKALQEERAKRDVLLAALEAVNAKFCSRPYGTGSYIPKPLRQQIASAIAKVKP